MESPTTAHKADDSYCAASRQWEVVCLSPARFQPLIGVIALGRREYPNAVSEVVARSPCS